MSTRLRGATERFGLVMAILYPSSRMGYCVEADGKMLIPAARPTPPKAGDWRVKRSFKVIDGQGKRVFNANGNAIRVPERGAAHQTKVDRVPIRGIKRVDNSENPFALGAKVFDQLDEKRDLWSPNRAKHAKTYSALAAAIETGALSLSDLDPRTAKYVKRVMEAK